MPQAALRRGAPVGTLANPFLEESQERLDKAIHRLKTFYNPERVRKVLDELRSARAQGRDESIAQDKRLDLLDEALKAERALAAELKQEERTPLLREERLLQAMINRLEESADRKRAKDVLSKLREVRDRSKRGRIPPQERLDALREEQELLAELEKKETARVEDERARLTKAIERTRADLIWPRAQELLRELKEARRGSDDVRTPSAERAQRSAEALRREAALDSQKKQTNEEAARLEEAYDRISTYGREHRDLLSELKYALAQNGRPDVPRQVQASLAANALSKAAALEEEKRRAAGLAEQLQKATLD